MTEEIETYTNRGKTPAELIADGKSKFALSLSRMRQRQSELALLSLLGSLEDVLRAHLLLHRNPAAEQRFPDVLAALRDDPEQPLSIDEVAGMRRLHGLRLRIAQGESVTLAQDSLVAYQQFAAAILPRYGVPVAVPDATPLSTQLTRFPLERRRGPALWRRSRIHLTPILIIVLIFIIGATATVVLQRSRTEPGVTVVADTPFVPQITTQAPQAPNVVVTEPSVIAAAILAPGKTAFVRPDVTGGLALRAQPSGSAPIRLYLSGGTAVEVLNGPVEADGHQWWQVRAANQEGWCAGEFLEVR